MNLRGLNNNILKRNGKEILALKNGTEYINDYSAKRSIENKKLTVINKYLFCFAAVLHFQFSFNGLISFSVVFGATFWIGGQQTSNKTGIKQSATHQHQHLKWIFMVN